MPIIKYISDNGLDTIKANMDGFIDMMRNNRDDASWIPEFLQMNPFVSTDYLLDFQFVMKGDDPSKTDYENAMLLYKAFESVGIKNAVIYDERFLSGFILSFGYTYFIWRWGLETKSHITDALFFSDSKRRAIARNSIGRLYQWVCLTKDETLDNPFELTKFAFENHKVFRIGFYPCFDGENVRLGYFKALKQWSEKGNQIPAIDKLLRHFTMLCGVNVAEAMSQQDIIDYIMEYLENNR